MLRTAAMLAVRSPTVVWAAKRATVWRNILIVYCEETHAVNVAQ